MKDDIRMADGTQASDVDSDKQSDMQPSQCTTLTQVSSHRHVMEQQLETRIYRGFSCL